MIFPCKIGYLSRISLNIFVSVFISFLNIYMFSNKQKFCQSRSQWMINARLEGGGGKELFYLRKRVNLFLNISVTLIFNLQQQISNQLCCFYAEFIFMHPRGSAWSVNRQSEQKINKHIHSANHQLLSRVCERCLFVQIKKRDFSGLKIHCTNQFF